MKTFPAEVTQGLEADRKRRAALILGATAVVAAAVIPWMATRPAGPYPPWAIVISVGLITLAICIHFSQKLLGRWRAGATLVDLGKVPFADKVRQSQRIITIIFGLMAATQMLNIAKEPGVAAAWALPALAHGGTWLSYDGRVRLSEHRPSLGWGSYPWSGLARPTWNEGRTALAPWRTSPLARLWSSWLVVPVPEEMADEVDSVLRERLPNESTLASRV